MGWGLKAETEEEIERVLKLQCYYPPKKGLPKDVFNINLVNAFKNPLFSKTISLTECVTFVWHQYWSYIANIS